MRFLKLTVLVAALALISQLAAAGEGDKILRFNISYVEPTGDFSESVSSGLQQELSIEAESAFGPEVGFEYMFTDMIGFDVNLGMFGHDVEAELLGDDAKIGDIDLMPLLFGANFHLMRDKKIDLYVGPSLGYIFFSDLDVVDDSSDVPVKDDFAYGANFGVDVPFHDNWSFSAGLRYLLVGAETDESGVENIEIDIDPFVVRVGFAYEF
jgi:outer membrane protein W